MKKIENFIGPFLFVLVFLIYAISVSNTISFWDSSEFIATNYHLQATHPPGAPFYTLLCNLVLLLFPSAWAAFISNLISAFFGALTVMFVYKIVKHISLKISGNKNTVSILSAVVSSLTLAFSDTFWTASTEAEVYTLSVFLLMFLFYLMLMWHSEKDQSKELKIVFLIVFLLGISLGVHLINLSILVPLSIIYVHKKYGLNWKSILLALGVSVVLFLSLYLIGIQGFLKIACWLDFKLVNSFSWPVNSGLFLLIFIFLGILFSGLYYAKKRHTPIQKYIVALLLFSVGASSYLMPLVRNHVESSISNQIYTSNDLLKYIQAKQFGVQDTPLLKGKICNAPLDKDFPFVDGESIYDYNAATKKYELVDDGKWSKVNYAHEFDMFFPRMYSQKSSSTTLYANWVAIKGEKLMYPVLGQEKAIFKPTFYENLEFFKNYQVEWLYLRYLYWNFIGKQNDTKGTGAVFNGNWQSGIGFFDEGRIGSQEVIPERYKQDKSNDIYYFLPFILGLLGLWSLRKQRVYFFSTLVFFLTFGIGIIIYVNPLPESILIRERDYIFMGSFIIFSIWIGLSLLSLNEWASKIKSEKLRLSILGLVVFIMSPLQLLAKNWDNHQRSGDTFAYDLAKKYLDSCPKEAILITNGDNFTFPLWYLQEVEHYRSDVRVVNYDLLNLSYYIDKLKNKNLSSNPLKISFSYENYREGNPKLYPLKVDTKESVDLALLFQFLNNDSTKITWNGKQQHYIPGDIFQIKVDTTQNIFANIDKKRLNAQFTSQITWKFSKEFYQLNDVIGMNLILENMQERPICFLVNGNREHYLGFQNYLVHTGFVEQLLPLERRDKEMNPKIVNTLESNLLFQKDSITFKNSDAFIKSENIEYAQTIIRRNDYFLAQALVEENHIEEAKKVLDKTFHNLPDVKVPYKQFAFALGKLYYKIGQKEKGNEVCLKSLNNIWDELQWITSFNSSANPIINVKQAVKLKEMYEQMIVQLEPFNPEKALEEKQKAIEFNAYFTKWHIRNWPY